MVLWVDKYRPSALAKCDYHSDVNVRLQKLVSSNDFPHLLLYGTSGAGKKTRVNAMLREMFGRGVDKIKVAHKSVKAKSKTIDISCLTSNYHIELNPSDVGINDRIVVQEIIKGMQQTTAAKHQQHQSARTERCAQRVYVHDSICCARVRVKHNGSYSISV